MMLGQADHHLGKIIPFKENIILFKKNILHTLHQNKFQMD